MSDFEVKSLIHMIVSNTDNFFHVERSVIASHSQLTSSPYYFILLQGPDLTTYGSLVLEVLALFSL